MVRCPVYKSCYWGHSISKIINIKLSAYMFICSGTMVSWRWGWHKCNGWQAAPSKESCCCYLGQNITQYGQVGDKTEQIGSRCDSITPETLNHPLTDVTIAWRWDLEMGEYNWASLLFPGGDLIKRWNGVSGETRNRSEGKQMLPRIVVVLL